MEFTPFSIVEKEDDRILTHEGIPIISLKIKYPEFSKNDSRAIKRLNRFYERIHHEYIKTVQKNVMPIGIGKYFESLENSREFIPFELSLSYAVTENSEFCLSLYREITEKCKKGRAEVFRFGDTWDTRTGWPILLCNFDRENKSRRFKKRLIAAAIAEAEKQTEKQEVQYYEDYKKRIKKYFDKENFYIKDEKLILFYPENTIAPAFEGIIEFAYDNCLQNTEK